MEYSQLIEILKTYMTEDKIKIINKYYEEATTIYEGMKRLTGEDYINHPKY